jgi:hypothetical protein
MIDRNGVSPSLVMTCGIAAVAIFSVLRSMFFVDAATIVGHTFCVIAYVIALVSCRRVASGYPQGSLVRLGWLAMSGNCILSIFRHVALNPALEHWLGPRDRVYLLSQAFQLPALLLVLFGMVSIWWGVYRLDLGFRLGWLDCAGIISVAALVTWIFRDSLSHANSVHGVTTIFQAVSLGLLIGIGGVGLLLHRLSMQMGGGRLAVVMRCFAVYGLTRTMLTLSQGNRESYSLLWWMFFFAVPWIFALGASYSSWLTDTVKRSIRQQSYSRGWYEA